MDEVEPVSCSSSRVRFVPLGVGVVAEEGRVPFTCEDGPFSVSFVAFGNPSFADISSLFYCPVLPCSDGWLDLNWCPSLRLSAEILSAERPAVLRVASGSDLLVGEVLRCNQLF